MAPGDRKRADCGRPVLGGERSGGGEGTDKEMTGPIGHRQLSACGSDRTWTRDPIEVCRVESRRSSLVAMGPAGNRGLACRRLI